MASAKRFVYVIRSCVDGDHYYTGVTHDVAVRLASHNNSECRRTAKYRPWRLDVSIEFGDERRAIAFEQYLKSRSGVAFAKRHLR